MHRAFIFVCVANLWIYDLSRLSSWDQRHLTGTFTTLRDYQTSLSLLNKVLRAQVNDRAFNSNVTTGIAVPSGEKVPWQLFRFK